MKMIEIENVKANIFEQNSNQILNMLFEWIIFFFLVVEFGRMFYFYFL